MPKTGWKYTKQQPKKDSVNMLKKSSASSKIGRVAPKRGGRTADTIKRLKMYANGKPIRNKEGTIVGGQFMMKDRAGDTEITAATGRIQPDRRWFGNTRVVNPTELDRFREEMNEQAADPYSVVLKRRKLPMGLLQDVCGGMGGAAGKHGHSGLLANEPFERTFGTKHRRKRVKLEQYMVDRKTVLEEDRKRKRNRRKQKNGGNNDDDDDDGPNPEGEAQVVRSVVPDNDSDDNGEDDDDNNNNNNEDGNGKGKNATSGRDSSSYAALMRAAQDSSRWYDEVNHAEGIVPWGRDSNLTKEEGEGVDWRHERKDDLFTKGQSRRIWAEFYKVLDCSDVVLHVIDARDVPGTRCTVIERHLTDHARHKHLVFVLNKVDLVPHWVAKRWIGILSSVRPTVAFHASLTHAFGKGALINLLRQFATLAEDKKMISVGVVGYPNVGKSSVINTLISKKSCKVAPIPGETKIWQYITLFKRISLIDCPGVVVNTADDSETDSVLKGVVRSERLETPQDFVPAILERVQRPHLAAHYGLPKSGDGTWTSASHLLELLALKSGRLFKGGEPDTRSSAIALINDFQRGKLPHYVAPPELKVEDANATANVHSTTETPPSQGTDPNGVVQVEPQDMDAIQRVGVLPDEDDMDVDKDEAKEGSNPHHKDEGTK